MCGEWQDENREPANSEDNMTDKSKNQELLALLQMAKALLR